MAAITTSYDVTSGDETTLAVNITTTQTSGIILAALRLNDGTEPLAATSGVLQIEQQVEDTRKVEWISFNGVTVNDDDTVTLTSSGVGRGLSRSGSTITPTGTGQRFNKGAKVKLVTYHFLLNQKADVDRANTFSATQTIGDNVKIQFGDSDAYIYTTDGGTNLKFKDASNSEITLSQIAAMGGIDVKVKVSSDDTNADFLANKITGGDGITVTEISGGGDEDLDIDIDLATDPGLEFSGGQLRAKIKAASGLVRDSDGLYVDSSFVETNSTVTNHLVPDDAMLKTAAASTVLPAYDTVTTGSGGAGTSFTTSHTNSGNTVVVGFHYNSGSALVSAITYGGQAMTLVDNYNNTPTGESNYFYILHNAPQGANDVAITLSSSATLTFFIASYHFFATNATPTLKNKGTGSGSASAAVTIVVDNSWMVGWGRAAGGTCSAGANTTKRAGSEQGLFDTNGVESPGSVSLAVSGTGTNVIIVAGVEPAGIVDALDFDASTEEYADFNFVLPPNFVTSSTISAKINWLAQASSGDVVWGVKGVGMSDGEAFGNAFGTEITQTDTVQTAKVCAATVSGITLGGTPAAGDLVTIRVSRKAASGSDTLAVDARLLSIQIIY